MSSHSDISGVTEKVEEVEKVGKTPPFDSGYFLGNMSTSRENNSTDQTDERGDKRNGKECKN